MSDLTPAALWHGLGWPMVRLAATISLALLVGSLVETLGWTRGMARLAGPVVRLSRLKDIAGASFAMAFFSGTTSNAMLAESHRSGELNDRELILSNLFNSMPTYFLHLPQVFFIAVPLIGGAAFTYIGLTLAASALRTAFIVVMGRLFLAPLPEGCVVCRLPDEDRAGWEKALDKTWLRFKRRLPRILSITLPIYALIFFLKRFGFFDWLEGTMSRELHLLSWLNPKALGVVAVQITAEFTAGLATAGSLLQNGELGSKDLVLALLVGNILSSPMRAIRHQFPYYAGFFTPAMAGKLIVCNQMVRAATLAVAAAAYYAWG